MKALLAKWFGASFKTSVIGYLQGICGMTGAFNMLLEFLPKEWTALLMAICALLITYGFVSAKSENVSHATRPDAPAEVVTLPSGTTLRNPIVPALLLPLLVLGVLGCGAATAPHTQAVFMKLNTDTHTAVVMGCKDLPGVEILITTIEPFLPPDPRVLAGEAVGAVAGQAAKALCAKVTQTPMVTSP